MSHVMYNQGGSIIGSILSSSCNYHLLCMDCSNYFSLKNHNFHIHTCFFFLQNHLFLIADRVIRKVCLKEEIKGKFHQNWD
jgi:hypothetical protein